VADGDLNITTTARPLAHGHILFLRQEVARGTHEGQEFTVWMTGSALAIEFDDPYRALIVDLKPLMEVGAQIAHALPPHRLGGHEEFVANAKGQG
jgi:hypothetical protein